MLNQETLGQVETSGEQKATREEISMSVGTSVMEATYRYKFYFLPFAKAFDLILKELELYEMVVYRKDCEELLDQVHSSLKKSTKFRKVALLAPVVVYTVFRAKGMTIKSIDFCEASKISLSDFKEGLLIVSPVYFDYVKRDREKFVSQLIDKIIAEFHMNSTFEDTARKIFKAFFSLFKNTKDNIITGLIIALSFVALDYKLPVLYDVFEALGTSLPRAHYHIRRKIFSPNQLGDFKGFVRSREQLKRFLQNMVLRD